MCRVGSDGLFGRYHFRSLAALFGGFEPAPPVLVAAAGGGGVVRSAPAIAPARSVGTPTAPPAAIAPHVVPRDLSAQERAERAADLAPSADGPDVDLGALATMIARAEKCSPADGLRRAHQRYERLSIAARTGRDPGPRSSRGEAAPARSGRHRGDRRGIGAA